MNGKPKLVKELLLTGQQGLGGKGNEGVSGLIKANTWWYWLY